MSTFLQHGRYLYGCLVQAHRMGYDVTGYLTVADDTLFNFWNFNSLETNHVWHEPMLDFNCSTGFDERGHFWGWWHGYKNRTFEALEFIKDESLRHSANAKRLKTFVNSDRFHNFLNRHVCLHGQADIFYVPNSKVEDVTYILEILFNKGIFLELAVPLTLSGLEERNIMVELTSPPQRKKDRPHIWKNYRTYHHYLHPIKFSRQNDASKFCSVYVPYLLKLLSEKDLENNFE